MAKANLLQPARLSLVADWERLVRQQYPQKARGMDLGVFGAPHRDGYSVVQETFPKNMEEATRILDDAFAKIFTLGQERVEILRGVSRQIEATQSNVSK
jgi:hypothetical protein